MKSYFLYSSLALIAIAIIFVWIIEYRKYIKYNNWKRTVEVFKYDYIKLSTTVNDKEWIDSFNLKPNWIVKKYPIAETMIGKIYLTLGIGLPKINDIIKLHLEELPKYKLFSVKHNTKSINYGTVKALNSIKGDIIEIGINENGHEMARILYGNEAVVIWTQEGDNAYEYSPVYDFK